MSLPGIRRVMTGHRTLTSTWIPSALTKARAPDTPQAAARAEERVAQLLAGQLLPYAEAAETTTETAARLTGYAVQAAKQAVELAPIGSVGRTAYRTINTMDFIRKYGLQGLGAFYLRQDIMQAAQVLYNASNKLGVDQPGMSQLVASLYYRTANNAGDQGRDPEAIGRRYAARAPSCAVMDRLQHYGPMGLFHAYSDVFTAQRHLSHQGYKLLLSELTQPSKEIPAFLLAVNEEQKSVVVAVRGSSGPLDWLANADFETEELAPGARAHRGALNMARWLESTLRTPLAQLEGSGYSVTATGHSLGAAVASLFTIIRNQQVTTSGGKLTKCVGFATPPVADQAVCELASGNILTVVLGNDMVPRTSMTNVKRLLERLSATEDWKVHAAADWQAVSDRFKNYWTPKSREFHGGSDANVQVSRFEFDRAFGDGESDSVFCKLDTNGDGILSKKELLVGQTSLGSLVPPAAAESSHATAATYPPGDLVLLYRDRAVFRAAMAGSPAAAGLADLEPHASMVSDHMVSEYWDALWEATNAVYSKSPTAELQPVWEHFGFRRGCSNCEAPFSWASSAQSLAQTHLDTHNCNQCGKLVCGDCSTHRQAIVKLAVRRPVRVCDECFFVSRFE